MEINSWQICEYKDLYNIYNLITKIDKGYRLVYSSKDKIFIVINSAKNNQICLKTSNLSTNIVNLLKKSRVENINQLIKEIDETNENIISNNTKKLKENVTSKMIDCLKFSQRTSSILASDINKIIGEKIC